MPGPVGTALFMIGHFLMSFPALHPNREQRVQSLSAADRRVVEPVWDLENPLELATIAVGALESG